MSARTLKSPLPKAMAAELILRSLRQNGIIQITVGSAMANVTQIQIKLFRPVVSGSSAEIGPLPRTQRL
jgi:hypothetical protein